MRYDNGKADGKDSCDQQGAHKVPAFHGSAVILALQFGRTVQRLDPVDQGFHQDGEPAQKGRLPYFIR